VLVKFPQKNTEALDHCLHNFEEFQFLFMKQALGLFYLVKKSRQV